MADSPQDEFEQFIRNLPVNNNPLRSSYQENSNQIDDSNLARGTVSYSDFSSCNNSVIENPSFNDSRNQIHNRFTTPVDLLMKN